MYGNKTNQDIESIEDPFAQMSYKKQQNSDDFDQFDNSEFINSLPVKFDQNYKILNDYSRENMFQELKILEVQYALNEYGIDIRANYTEQKQNIIKSLIKNGIQMMSDTWKQQIVQSIDNIQECKRKQIVHDLKMTLEEQGFPEKSRFKIWKFLIGNSQRINTQIFEYYNDELTNNECSNIIYKDLTRTFCCFQKNNNFKKILQEAYIILKIFELHRPDIKYVQGMSYPVVLFLLNYKPKTAFKLFTNLIMNESLLYYSFYFDNEFIAKVHTLLSKIVYYYFTELYEILEQKKQQLWKMVWMDWIMTLYLRMADLDTVLIIWDNLLIYGNYFCFKLFYIIFQIFNDNFNSLDQSNLCQALKQLIWENRKQILKDIVQTKVNIRKDVPDLDKFLKQIERE